MLFFSFSDPILTVKKFKGLIYKSSKDYVYKYSMKTYIGIIKRFNNANLAYKKRCYELNLQQITFLKRSLSKSHIDDEICRLFVAKYVSLTNTLFILIKTFKCFYLMIINVITRMLISMLLMYKLFIFVTLYLFVNHMQYMYVQTQMCEFKKCMFIIKVYIHNWSVIKCTTDTGQGQEMYLKSVMKFKENYFQSLIQCLLQLYFWVFPQVIFRLILARTILCHKLHILTRQSFFLTSTTLSIFSLSKQLSPFYPKIEKQYLKCKLLFKYIVNKVMICLRSECCKTTAYTSTTKYKTNIYICNLDTIDITYFSFILMKKYITYAQNVMNYEQMVLIVLTEKCMDFVILLFLLSCSYMYYSLYDYFMYHYRMFIIICKDISTCIKCKILLVIQISLYVVMYTSLKSKYLRFERTRFIILKINIIYLMITKGSRVSKLVYLRISILNTNTNQTN